MLRCGNFRGNWPRNRSANVIRYFTLCFRNVKRERGENAGGLLHLMSQNGWPMHSATLELYAKYMQLSRDQLRLSRRRNDSWFSELVECRRVNVYWKWQIISTAKNHYRAINTVTDVDTCTFGVWVVTFTFCTQEKNWIIIKPLSRR